MIKKDLVSSIAERTGTDIIVVQSVIENFMKLVINKVAEGEEVNLRGFGTYKPVLRKAKKGRVITRNELINVPACYKPVFRASDRFKKKVKTSLIPKS